MKKQYNNILFNAIAFVCIGAVCVLGDVLTIPHRWEPGDARRPNDFSENYDAIEGAINGKIDSFNVEDDTLLNADINSAAGIVDTKFGCGVTSNWKYLTSCDSSIDNANALHSHDYNGRFIGTATGGATITVATGTHKYGLMITLTNHLQASAPVGTGCKVCQTISINGTELDNCDDGGDIDTYIDLFATNSTTATSTRQIKIIYDSASGYVNTTAYSIKPSACAVVALGGACAAGYPTDNYCAATETRMIVEGF